MKKKLKKRKRKKGTGKERMKNEATMDEYGKKREKQRGGNGVAGNK